MVQRAVATKLGELATQQAEHWQAIQAEEAALLLWLERLPPESAAEVARTGIDFAGICGPLRLLGLPVPAGPGVADAGPDRLIPLQLLVKRSAAPANSTTHSRARRNVPLWRRLAEMTKRKPRRKARSPTSIRPADSSTRPCASAGGGTSRLRKARRHPRARRDDGKIADIYQARGQLDEALRIRRGGGTSVYEKLGDIRSRAVTMGQIADISRPADSSTRPCIRRGGTSVYEKLGDIRSRAVTMGQIADIYQAADSSTGPAHPQGRHFPSTKSSATSAPAP